MGCMSLGVRMFVRFELRVVGCTDLTEFRRLPPHAADPTRVFGKEEGLSRWLELGWTGSLGGAKIHPRGGQKGSPEGSGSLLGARSAPGGHQGCSETASGRLLGRSWGALGVVLGPLGSLPAPPGPLLGLILASRGRLVSRFLVSF